MIQVTDRALSEIRTLLLTRHASEKEGLRFFVEKGGCAGLQYGMKVAAGEENDFTFEREGVKIFVDGTSLPLLSGATIDFSDSLTDSGFKVNNPQAARSCGCGTSFEPATPVDPKPPEKSHA